MCGLAGIYAYSPDAPHVDAEELHALREAMVARGPDGAGSWMAEDGRLGLAHRRLAIIDLSDAAAQPMASDDGRLVVVHNGEIYNHQALREELEAKGHVFRTTSDTEVLLHLYKEEGRDMVRRLRGMFAFAIWDTVERGLFLARDPFGIKPLYFADDGRTFRFASQVKALKAGGQAGTERDPAATVGFFLFGSVPDPLTLYKDIRALKAGTSLWVGSDGTRRPDTHFNVTDELADSGDTTADLGVALRDSIKHHLIADVPVGVFLSAGLDSATIASLASEVHGAGLHSFTLGFEEFKRTECDEVPLAEAAARAFGTEHDTRWVKGADFRADHDALLAAMDQPSIDGVNTYFVSKAARSAGLKVALSGLGGDELFGGYDTFTQVPKLVRHLHWVPRPLGRAFRAVSAKALAARTSPKWAGVLEYGTRYGDAYLLRRGLFMPWELPQVLDPDLVRAGWEALQPLARLENLQGRIASERGKVQALETAWYMRNQLLRDADWAGMAHSLEIRVPLVDPMLFRAVAPLEASKRDMALTPETRLPDAILERPKTGFFVPVQQWLQGEGDNTGSGARGYRDWAQKVYAAFSE